MRKLFAALLLIFLVSGAAATTIESETLYMDLQDSTAEAEIKVGDLTSSQFTYITAAKIRDVNARINGEPADCQVETLTIGSEIQCDTELRENFTVNIEYSFNNLVATKDDVRTFRYSHPIYRPTESFTLKTTLPPGTGLVEGEGSSFEPADGRIGSDGRRIFVEWKTKPQLGDTLSYEINYRDYRGDQGLNYLEIAVVVALTVLIFTGVMMYWRRRNMEELDTVYSNLSEDQQSVVDLLKENDGEMLQKDVVSQTDYSKAKISGVVSELVDEGIIEKEKEGRSNKLKISGSYRF